MECIQEKSTLSVRKRKPYRTNKGSEDKVAILDTVRALQKRYSSNYCYPSQTTLRSLLKQWHGIDLSERTLNRRLAEMEQEKSLRRRRRLKVGKSGRLEFWTTLYYIVQYPIAAVKNFLRTCNRISGCFPSANIGRQSLTTKRDLSKNFEDAAEKVPLEWIKDFRLQLQSA